MRRVPGVALLAILAGVPTVGRQQAPSFQSGTHSVSVYASVLSADGRLVPNLKQEDFEVLADGQVQPLTIFENGIQPITIVVMLDRSGSMVGNFVVVE